MDGSFEIGLSQDDIGDPRSALLARLQQAGVLNAAEADHVQSVIKESREALDQVICKLGLATEDALADAYAQIFSLPRFDEDSLIEAGNNTARELLPDTLKSRFNKRYLFARRIMPMSAANGRVTAALVDPSDSEAIAGLAFASELDVTFSVATASEFDRLFALAFPASEDNIAGLGAVDASADVNHLKDMASTEPVVRYVNRIISEASRKRASDIHIEPMDRQTQIRLRVDGILTDFETLPTAQALSVISRFKILAELDIAEQRRPQDGRMSFPVGGHVIDLRLSTNPTVNGESMVVRLLDQSRAPLDLKGLGFSDSVRQHLLNWINAPNGILLLTGPTGSGKTTTLYALLRLLATGERKILTIEDPVEYKLAGVNQSQVNTTVGLTFANALRSFLRHDPDVIMVGEMRDAETARIAMRAAMTGHLVLSTLHTNDAASAVTRLLDMGVEDYLVASTLLGVVGQRLVRRRRDKCLPGSPHAACEQSAGEGYHGRIVIAEAMPVDEHVRAIIKSGVTSADINAAAQHSGFVSMLEDGRRKADNGLVSPADVQRIVS